MRYRGMLVLTLVAAAGCDDRPPVAGGLLAPVPLTSAGARAYVVQEAGGTADRVTLTIHVDAKDIPIAAYQGRLQFDPDALEIIEATTPSDGTRLVNAATAGPGLVKFAGFSTEVFGQTAAVRLVVKPLKPIAMANLVASLDVVGEVSGAAVTKDRLLQARGIYTAVLAK